MGGRENLCRENPQTAGDSRNIGAEPGFGRRPGTDSCGTDSSRIGRFKVSAGLSTTFTRSLHEPAGLIYHGGALLYALLAYGCGFAGLFSANAWLYLPSVLLLAHGMIIAA